MPSCQSDQDFECEGWSKVTAFPILGHLIAAGGAVNPCIDQALAAAWRAFWRFVRKAGVSALSTALRLRQINMCVAPIILFRAPRWAFTLSNAERLNRMQRKMLRIVLPIRVIASETPESFARRSGRIVSHVRRMVAPWGALWACRVISWAGHALRDTKGLCWSASILDVRSSAELSARRSLNSNRPEARKQGGWSNRRWTDGVGSAQTYLDKFMSERENARIYRGAEFSIPFLRSLIPAISHLEPLLCYITDNKERL